MPTLVSPETEPVSVSRSYTPSLTPRTILLIAAALLTILLLRTAWVSEDAYISFRVLDNLLNGYGLRWNIADRVQTFTDPLFLAIVTVATWLSGNVYLAAIAVSLLITLAAFFLITKNASEIGLVTATTALVFSKAFIDFSISGMENPATHLAIAAYLFAYWRRRNPFTLTLIAALAATNRADSVLFFLPSLALVYFRTDRRFWKPALLGWSPYLAWSLFALFYYGFMFPNTAYAKLDTGIPARDMIFQGIVYYMNALRFDTATMFVIALGLIVAYSARERALALGIVLNLIYIVRVGGDFMSARFFSASLFLSVALIARYWRPERILGVATLVIIAALGMWVPSPTITSANFDFGAPWPVDPGGIADERAVYAKAAGLLHYRRNVLWPTFPLTVWGDNARRSGKKVFVFGNIGMAGYTAGPHVHIIDNLALGDAFLARLPVSGGWRIGHFPRKLPEGYEETINTGMNCIADPHLHEYYDHLHTVISGDLWSLDRFKEIFLFNIGHYDYLVSHRK